LLLELYKLQTSQIDLIWHLWQTKRQLTTIGLSNHQ
jgi:hypothetical protein